MEARKDSVHFISLGCPRNLVDTEVMLGLLIREGYKIVARIEEASAIIVNTCGFLEVARQEALKVLGEVFGLRRKGAKVIVTGCMVQRDASELKKNFPEIHFFLGTGEIDKILWALQDRARGSLITANCSYLEKEKTPRVISTPSHYAYLKIAEGCRKRCSYCLIPTIKGPLKSKPLKQIIDEFRTLRKQGVKEIIFIAQDLGDWGKDFGYKRSEGLEDLLKEVLKEKGDFWVRLLYLYPDEITPSLIHLIRSDPRICPYVDIPIQHVDPAILKAMHRATSREEIIRILLMLRMEIPRISIRTSLIVGFPGETEKQFKELIAFIEEYPFEQLGIFRYSQEEGTAAFSLPHQISEKVKAEREKRLAKAQQSVLKRRLRGMIGQRLRVLVEGYHPDSSLLMRGRHAGQAPEIDGEVIINDGRKVDAFGEWYSVEITDVSEYDLIGKVL